MEKTDDMVRTSESFFIAIAKLHNSTIQYTILYTAATVLSIFASNLRFYGNYENKSNIIFLYNIMYIGFFLRISGKRPRLRLG